MMWVLATFTDKETYIGTMDEAYSKDPAFAEEYTVGKPFWEDTATLL